MVKTGEYGATSICNAVTKKLLLCTFGRLPGSEEPIYKIARGVTRAHGLECFQISHKIFSHFCSKGPKGFVSDHVQSEIPAFRALTRQILSVDDFETTSNEMGFIVVHRFEINEHSSLDGFDKFVFLSS